MSTPRTNPLALMPYSVQKAYAGFQRSLLLLQINAELSTVLTIGMCLQTIAFIALPRYVAATPAMLYLICKALYSRPSTITDNKYVTGARLGRWCATVPNDDGTMPEKPGTNGVVCFVVGSQLNHPLGLLAPGVAQMGGYFNDMWRDAEANAEKWGYLSRTPLLLSQGAGRGNYQVQLSYWKSIDHLRNFATHSVHADGRRWLERTRQQHAHIGTFHETYVVPPGHYETIYENFHPFGMGQIGLGKEEGFQGGDGEALVKAVGKKWRTMAPTVPKKRKPTSHPNPTNPRSAKRVKILEARTILAQSPDKALNTNGDLEVSAFVRAREFEIQAIGKSMRESKQALSTRAFQQVPKNMRRRTASHDVKRVPRRMRVRAAREVRTITPRPSTQRMTKMKDDNTPTGKSRKRKPTPHQRLRLEKAKVLKQKGALMKKKRAAAKKQKPGETDPEKMVELAPRLPTLKKNTLSKRVTLPARFRKRQVHKSWLPTHLWHAKRAHMTEPKYPLWRFAVPLTPTEKCFRTTHRAAAMRGCVAWDTSYMGTIGIEGVEVSLLGVLRSIGIEEGMLNGRNGAKWRKGTRGWKGWIKERDLERRWIAPVRIVWGAEQEDETAEERMMTASKREAKRKMLLQVHPSAFLQAWNEILKVAKMQRPPAMIEDLRFELGSIEITGPGSTEALIEALHPSFNKGSPINDLPQSTQTTYVPAAPPSDDAWGDIETPQKLWTQLAALTNPSALPANALLAFNITDPRLHHPPRTTPIPDQKTANETLLSHLASWPPDHTQLPADIFHRTKRLTASRLLASQKSINRRKAAALPGQYPDPSSKDPHIPILLLASRSATANSSAQGKWTLLLPWDCVLPVWYSLMHYPLSTGGAPRFACLQEKQQITFEQGGLWFPGDFPGTKAGWDWEMREREIGRKEWVKRPRGKRCEWESIDLGKGRKGEIGKGWACDWERLVLGRAGAEAVAGEAEAKESGDEGLASQPNDLPKQTASHDSQKELPLEPPAPPYGIHHLPASLIPSLLARPTTTMPRTALTPIHLTLLTNGHPKRCARIYRLPSTNRPLRDHWVALAVASYSPPPCNPKASKKDIIPKQQRPTTAAPRSSNPPAHERAQALAANLLTPIASKGEAATAAAVADTQIPPKPGDSTYPPVPDEEDLIGFLTSATYHLGSGRCEAIGNVLVTKALNIDTSGDEGAESESRDRGGSSSSRPTNEPSGEAQKEGNKEEFWKSPIMQHVDGTAKAKKTNAKKKKLCIIRDAGQGFGRLARWEFFACLG
ncbi:MAG: hypothetical protein Q9217_004862 [Psora testacea]